VNLGGFGNEGSAMRPRDALRGFIEALGVPASRVPNIVEARGSLYRSLLAGRRALIVLDNARDVDQVRPLLPGSPGSMVIVTSRNRLTGLVATHDARLLTLEPFFAAEAREILSQRLGAARVDSEPEAADEIIGLCAGLPLALAIVAAHATVRRNVPLRSIASQLWDASSRLDAFDSNDTATDVRTVFSWSYRLLTDPAARLFRLLSLHSGPDISRAAAASMAGLPVDEVRRPLCELIQSFLLTEHQYGRFVYHDLLRAYAAELSIELDTGAERQAAVERLSDYYLHSSHAAHLMLRPHGTLVELTPAAPGVTPAKIDDYAEAMEWFGAERHALNAAVRHAADNALSTHAWQLALTLQQFYQRQGYWHDWAITMQTALRAAQDLGDPAAQARVHRSLAGALHFLGNQDEALAHLDRARELFTELGHTTEYAFIHDNLGCVLTAQGHPEEAIVHHLQALELHRTIGHRKGQAVSLESIGRSHVRQGGYERALRCADEAMDLYRELDDRNGEGYCWLVVGESHMLLERPAVAVDCYERAIALFQDVGNRSGEAEGLAALGDVLLGTDDLAAARTAWRSSLSIVDELRLPTAESIRAKLSCLEDQKLGISSTSHYLATSGLRPMMRNARVAVSIRR
jgi:tetratricopeptide (TPR) repeat protein